MNKRIITIYIMLIINLIGLIIGHCIISSINSRYPLLEVFDDLIFITIIVECVLIIIYTIVLIWNTVRYGWGHNI